MLRIAFAAAICCALPVAVAQAADGMPEGAYVGVTAGFGTTNFIDEIYSGYGGAAGGVIAGGQIGYNVNWGPAIVGIEADATWNSAAPESTWNSTYHMDWEASLRARLGFDIGQNFVPYVAGGVIVTHASNTQDVDTWANTPVGWTLGIGAEFPVSARLTGRVEFRHDDFGSDNYGYIVKPTQDSLRVGFNYYFGK